MSANFRTQRGATDIDPGVFQEVLNRPTIAKEFFLPLERAGWEGEVYTLGRGQPLRPSISGVRLQEPDRNKQDSAREKACQIDLTALVKSIMEMRRTTALAGVVLSPEVQVGRDASQPGCKRIIFGLACPADGRFKSDEAAVAECHRQILHGITRAGFVVEHPKMFDPKTGFKGLLAWTNDVRLRRRLVPLSPWTLLLLALLLLPLLFLAAPRGGTRVTVATVKSPADFFGMAVETSSFLIVVDKSGSMAPYFSAVQAEVKRMLNDMLQSDQGVHYVDLIIYDSEAKSALGRMERLTPEIAGRLAAYLDQLQAGGGTLLEKAVELAAQEVRRHGQKTTLLILTDGEDQSLQSMIQGKEQVKGRFGGVEVTMHTTTPRLFKPGANPNPVNVHEKLLRDFSQTFNGRFGPQKGSP
ncbi:MAG: vWA domain-containing protein [Gemmataceae bacterium]|nr:vWA domain-containing protein [Gemmataceae bacterium]